MGSNQSNVTGTSGRSVARWKTKSVAFCESFPPLIAETLVASSNKEAPLSTPIQERVARIGPSAAKLHTFATGLVPDLLKIAKVVPIYNKKAVLPQGKPRDAASVLFGRSSPTTFLTSIRLAMLRKPRFRAPNMLAQNTI